jgi:lipid A 3-O-deacylase
MRLIAIVAALAALLLSFGAHAAAPLEQPDLFSVGVGYANFDKGETLRNSADIRFEYRWGQSLLPLLSNTFNDFNHFVQIHPFVSMTTSSLGVLYGLGGLDADLYIGRHGIVSWNEGVGLFFPGYGRPMGSVIEFRSTAEAGWRFDDETRLTFYASHISNAKITERNPGSEILGFYVHVPVDWLSAKTDATTGAGKE